MRSLKYLVLIAVLITSGVVYSNFAKVIRTTQLILGLGVDGSDVSVEVDRAGANNPQLLYSDANERWEFSNDGVTTKALGAGKGIHQNILQNSNFDIEDKITQPFTIDQAGVLAVESGNPAFETSSLSWTPDAGTPESLYSALVAVPQGYYNKQCEARLYYKGGPAGMTFKVTDGTTPLVEKALSQPAVFTEASVTFVCPSSGNIQIQIDAPATGTVVYFDDFYIGENLTEVLVRDGDGVVAEGYYSISQGASTCGDGWSTASTTFVALGTDADCPSITLVTEKYGATIDTTDNNTFDIVVDNLPAGQFLVQAFFQSTSTNPTDTVFRITDGSTQGQPEIDARTATANTPRSVNAIFNYSSSATRTFSMQALVGSGSVNLSAPASLGGQARWRVTRLGDKATERAVPQELQGWYIDANIGGIDISGAGGISSGAVTNYQHVYVDGLDIVVNGDSAPVGITCISGEASTPTTSSCAGAESFGWVFDAPTAGVYEACASFSTFGDGGSARWTWQLIETTNTCTDSFCDLATDGLQEGKSRLQGGISINSAKEDVYHLCGTFKFASPGQKTIRAMYEKPNTSASNRRIYADRDGNTGQRDIHITVKPLAPYQPAPLLLGNLNMAEEAMVVTVALVFHFPM
jgi:hypothetical protein